MSRTLRFTKMHGAGNDYVVLDGIREELPPIPPLLIALCVFFIRRANEREGVSADRLL